LVFLQYLPQPEDEELASNLGFEVEKPDDAFQNIYEVAHWILKCESVITIDNYIVHLSGALGAKTLALLPFSCSYRWALDNHICPIYKNVKLKRQTRVNDWASIVDHSIYPWK
jgi:ADP-heptose:LPS heptosyltransferase